MVDSQAEEPSTGIVNHSWGACVGVVDPQGPWKALHAVLLPCCLGELDRGKNELPSRIVISHQHDMSEREGRGEWRSWILIFKHPLHNHFHSLYFFCRVWTKHSRRNYADSLFVISHFLWAFGTPVRCHHATEVNFACALVARNHTK